MPEVSFQERIEIFPRSVKGRYRSIKSGILLLAYTVYFLLPWLRWSREVGPEQAILFDIESRRFYIFDLVVYAQDIFWLAGLLLIAAFLLFFVTGLAGRRSGYVRLSRSCLLWLLLLSDIVDRCLCTDRTSGTR